VWTTNNTIGNSSITQSNNGDQTINGNLNVTRSVFLPNTTGHNTGAISIGGLPVLHTFGSQNTFVGPSAGNFTMTGGANTATGIKALFSNTTGNTNSATGGFALLDNTTGSFNTAMGDGALGNNTTGIGNTAMGSIALANNTTGSFNIAIGFLAGDNITGDNNIDIGSGQPGIVGESNTIRIGSAFNDRTFIAGIAGVNVGPAAAVLVNSAGQLGTMSSSRFKDDIQDMGDASSDLMKLRPVTFRYKQAQEDGSHPLQYGLVAEEVADVNPGLVQFDKDGQPQTVLYHVLPAMLLNEVQKEHQKIEDQQKLIQDQQEQLKAQEERLRKLEAILSSKTN
jgi:hypothetical protein